MSQGGHPEQLLFSALFYQSTPSCLKVIGGVVVVVAHSIIVSAQGPNPSFFSFFGGLLFDLGACWDKDLDQGLTINLIYFYCIGCRLGSPVCLDLLFLCD